MRSWSTASLPTMIALWYNKQNRASFHLLHFLPVSLLVTHSSLIRPPPKPSCLCLPFLQKNPFNRTFLFSLCDTASPPARGLPELTLPLFFTLSLCKHRQQLFVSTKCFYSFAVQGVLMDVQLCGWLARCFGDKDRCLIDLRVLFQMTSPSRRRIGWCASTQSVLSAGGPPR